VTKSRKEEIRDREDCEGKRLKKKGSGRSDRYKITTKDLEIFPLQNSNKELPKRTHFTLK
jgi:hypothetical protein